MLKKKGDPIFQIEPGPNSKSIEFANIAYSVWNQLNSSLSYPLIPKIRPWLDPFSYLFNTDGSSFTTLGFPGMLINEHINLYQNFNRVGYHDTSDTSALINWDYGTSVAKIAIQTIKTLSSKKGKL